MVGYPVPASIQGIKHIRTAFQNRLRSVRRVVHSHHSQTRPETGRKNPFVQGLDPRVIANHHVHPASLPVTATTYRQQPGKIRITHSPQNHSTHLAQKLGRQTANVTVSVAVVVHRVVPLVVILRPVTLQIGRIRVRQRIRLTESPVLGKQRNLSNLRVRNQTARPSRRRRWDRHQIIRQHRIHQPDTHRITDVIHTRKQHFGRTAVQLNRPAITQTSQLCRQKLQRCQLVRTQPGRCDVPLDIAHKL